MYQAKHSKWEKLKWQKQELLNVHLVCATEMQSQLFSFAEFSAILHVFYIPSNMNHYVANQHPTIPILYYSIPPHIKFYTTPTNSPPPHIPPPGNINNVQGKVMAPDMQNIH